MSAAAAPSTPSLTASPSGARVEPALKFNTTPYHPNDSGNILLRFREQGFAVAPGVFERDSVDPFLERSAQRFVRRKIGGRRMNCPRIRRSPFSPREPRACCNC